jgi:predicted transcriptional regulator of viral defense system
MIAFQDVSNALGLTPKQVRALSGRLEKGWGRGRAIGSRGGGGGGGMSH